jgi:hypothetical protein
VITVPLVRMAGVLITATVDETDKPTTDSPGRIDSITIALDPGVAIQFVLTNPSGQSRDVSVAGPHNQTYTVPGAARFRRTSWGWSIQVIR